MSQVYGIDPSLTSLGISDGVRHEAIRTEAGQPTKVRVEAIRDGIERFICSHRIGPAAFTPMLWVIEAPLLSSMMGAGHLYELGHVKDRIDLLAEKLWPAEVRIIEIPSPTLRKWALGKGNVAKSEMPLAVYKKFGAEFADDKGCDKLFAFLLHRYGMAVLAGEVEHMPSKERGKGKRSVAATKRALKTKGQAA